MRTSVFSEAGSSGLGSFWTNDVATGAWDHTASSKRPSNVIVSLVRIGCMRRSSRVGLTWPYSAMEQNKTETHPNVVRLRI
jgi:hypothetical protein